MSTAQTKLPPAERISSSPPAKGMYVTAAIDAANAPSPAAVSSTDVVVQAGMMWTMAAAADGGL